MKGGEYLIYPKLSFLIVGSLFEVSNKLGVGYKETVYQKAIQEEFSKKGIKYDAQLSYLIKYNNKIIGRRYLDFLVEDKVILEIKKGDYYRRQNYTQVFEYLKISKLKLAILANFTSSGVKFKRIANTY